MTQENLIENAVEQGGSYDVIKKRLNENSKVLSGKVDNLNNARIEQFGSLKQELITTFNIHSENNAVPIDMTAINDTMLVGYNVFIGMKSSIKMDDIFSIFKIERKGTDCTTHHVPLAGSFLDNEEFKRAFTSLISYNKDANFFQFINEKERLYVIFQIGKSTTDLKVFTWIKDRDGNYKYAGDGNTTEILEKTKNKFNGWVQTDRTHFVAGKYPHISILDKLFVETVGGDLTIKLENNTNSGQGIYSEPVDNAHQNLEDAEIYYIDAGDNIVLRIKPFQEINFRYFIFNTITQKVIRCDGVGISCINLPENHGFIFSNGYYLKSGEYKIFDVNTKYNFLSSVKSQNGEDYMYVFFDAETRSYVLYPYNLVTKTISNPIFTNGYSLFDDGSLYVIKAQTEASKVHPIQLWKTSYLSDIEYAKFSKETVHNFYTKIGNAELVRCISDVYTILTLVGKKEVTMNLYESIIKASTKLLDDYHWLGDDAAFKIKDTVKTLIDTSVLVINEFEKVLSIQHQAKATIESTKAQQKDLVSAAKVIADKEVSKYIQMLGKLKAHLGHLITIRTQRYIDIDEVKHLEEEINEVRSMVNEKLIKLLQDKTSFDYYHNEATSVDKSIETVKKLADLEKPEASLTELISQINIVNDEINEISFKDATVVSVILDSISNVFAKLNQIKAKIKNVKKGLMSVEAKLEFTSQINLLSQTVSSALTISDTPEKCDEQMTRILNQIEALESKFSDFEEFINVVYKKREEIKDVFENHKEQLINEKQKRISGIVNVADMTLGSIKNKVGRISKIEELNSYFAADSLVLKYNQFVDTVKSLGDNTKADELFSKFKNVKDQSLRQLRDSQDIFEDNGNIMKMGKHRFSVNKAPVDLTMVVKDGKNYLHITSTNFYEEITNAELDALRNYIDHDVLSESKEIYRSEFLAYSVLTAAIENTHDLNMEILGKAIADNKLLTLVSDFSSTLYREGYIKGVHDHDAVLILKDLFTAYSKADVLRFNKVSRIIAGLAYPKIKESDDFKALVSAYKYGKKVFESVGNNIKYEQAIEKLVSLIVSVLGDKHAEFMREAALVIFESESSGVFFYPDVVREYYDLLVTNISDIMTQFEINSIEDALDLVSIIQSYGHKVGNNNYTLMAEEIVYYSIIKKDKSKGMDVNTVFTIKGLIGQHVKIENGSITIELDDLLARAAHHKAVVMPAYQKVSDIKYKMVTESKEKFRIDDFKAKPLSSFVRNKLISESYLHLIGDNLAKQMGTMGEQKRTDLMGMLLLISPPGYGKTTLVEYVAQKLGLVFMKINCPSLGHSITSLDPAEAGDATSKKEIEKINLAFEMGNNVMLYLDDIQHTNPEFLQKFISLCDGSRKVDGVWNGKPKTYDFKGKKFAVVMAGNPYTESGEVFKIPDMLSNRADIYNLGDMLSGQQDVFELSYIENSLTSNSVLAPLANRNLADLYKFIENAKGANNPLNEFDYNYSQAEATEIVDVITKMLKVQAVVLRVNQQYISSAGTADKYRVEPPFKLQGSYRNMNKMSEKVVSAMNDKEIETMILDHYLGEAQTLTQGTEENLLKLKEILGFMTKEEEARFVEIKKDFMRNKISGDADMDGMTKITQQLIIMNEFMKDKIEADSSYNEEEADNKKLIVILEQIAGLQEQMKALLPNAEKDSAITELMNTLNIHILSRVKAREQTVNPKKP